MERERLGVGGGIGTSNVNLKGALFVHNVLRKGNERPN